MAAKDTTIPGLAYGPFVPAYGDILIAFKDGYLLEEEDTYW